MRHRSKGASKKFFERLPTFFFSDLLTTTRRGSFILVEPPPGPATALKDAADSWGLFDCHPAAGMVA